MIMSKGERFKSGYCCIGNHVGCFLACLRKKFFSKIEDAINNHGGPISLYDTIDL